MYRQIVFLLFLPCLALADDYLESAIEQCKQQPPDDSYVMFSADGSTGYVIDVNCNVEEHPIQHFLGWQSETLQTPSVYWPYQTVYGNVCTPRIDPNTKKELFIPGCHHPSLRDGAYVK